MGWKFAFCGGLKFLMSYYKKKLQSECAARSSPCSFSYLCASRCLSYYILNFWASDVVAATAVALLRLPSVPRLSCITLDQLLQMQAVVTSLEIPSGAGLQLRTATDHNSAPPSLNFLLPPAHGLPTETISCIDVSLPEVQDDFFFILTRVLYADNDDVSINLFRLVGHWDLVRTKLCLCSLCLNCFIWTD